MAERIVIDPITRIEGHLRIEIDVNDQGIISEALSSGTMIRGLEKIMVGRDPRDAWAYLQRVCGVCTTVHSIASLRAVEDALDIRIPKNANLIRDIITYSQHVADHVVHFYHLHALDWVDVVSALSADPQEAARIAQSLSNYPKNSPGYFSDVQKRLKTFVESGQLGIFANAYWGHPAYKLPPEVNLLAVAHYLDALEWQKEIVKIHAILGGKNPHPHFVVGGVACAIDLNSDTALNTQRFNQIQKLISQAKDIVEQMYIPDLMAIASFYKDWTYGGGLKNYLSFGDFATPGNDVRDMDTYLFPSGAILNGDLSTVHDVDVRDYDQIQEFVDYTWLKYSDGAKGKHPWFGETTFDYTGPAPGYKELDETKPYTWNKAPRWRGHSMEVGPLARVLVAYAKGVPDVKNIVDWAAGELDIPLSALMSTLGRTAARGLETKLFVDRLQETFDALIANIKSGDTVTFDNSKWDPKTWHRTDSVVRGVGWNEAPRGGLLHYIVIEKGKIKSYQAVVPSTWNASPRDTDGVRGAYEEALVGTPMADPHQPLEVIRTIHSFDPCMACAVHLVDKNKKEITQINVIR
ncbi:nickel-dependent hydrogenase large subunit [Desulfuribacillus alkaliarsenatis]|uniref:Hydrogenase n=1 Tax=Desulfuribacillus alkaliarsenatis TaxID=766136 RepID=A0A1E5G0R4_9FIRM|nr:nickel-dependent hydrogenase large subunit [Desulfuribacillus alkaliarsenatis]OEF96495.1 hydrogenase [Desulfuribacillus alkaliarsenatis]